MLTSVLRVFLPLLLAFGGALAMFEDPGQSIRARGMAGAFAAVADDVSAGALNPAGLYQVTGHQFIGSYRLLYGGAGVNLHTGSAGFAMPVPKVGVMSLGFVESGFALNSERALRLSHGIQLAEGLALGYGLSGYNLYQKDVGSGFAFGLDLGMFTRVYRSWTLGFLAQNLNQPKIGSAEQGELPRRLVFGFGYSPNPGIHSALDIEKEPGKGTRVRIGQELRIIQDHLTLRCGVQTEPVSFAFGLRAGVKFASLDYALNTHPQLGLSHSFGVNLEF